VPLPWLHFESLLESENPTAAAKAPHGSRLWLRVPPVRSYQSQAANKTGNKSQRMNSTSLPLKICYRAEFEQPGPVLNPSGWKVPGPIGVEVRKIAGHWGAYRPGTKFGFNEIAMQIDAETLMRQVPLFFERQLSPWLMYEISEPSGTAILLKPEEIERDGKGRVYRKETPKK
jgi:hypothetical protein